MSNQNLRVFQMDDCDWWVGESADSCIEDRHETYGPDEEFDREEVHELSDQQMQALVCTDEDGSKHTFKEQLDIEIASGGDFPRLFATTEF